jgi:hypothetical protein
VSARCGTPRPSENMKALHVAYQAHEANAAKGPASRQLPGNVIDTYIHVIQSGDSMADGAVPECQISHQVRCMLLAI